MKAGQRDPGARISLRRGLNHAAQTRSRLRRWREMLRRRQGSLQQCGVATDLFPRREIGASS